MTHLQPQEVLLAAQRLDGIVNRTPVHTSRTLNARCGGELFLKCENFQRVGAFKFRGAYHAISRLSAEEKARGVITFSSGNHAQGLALAAQLLGVTAVVVMPENAPPIKRAATEGYGAHVVTCSALEREKVAAELVAEHGYTFIHPYDNDNIILGQGSAAVELFQECGELDYLFVPVGGGGLISGSALATAALSPFCQVVGVEPEMGADANQSWREGRIVTLDAVPQTIADGLRTRFVGERNLAVMRQYVHDMRTVSEAQIMETLQFVWTYLKLIIEPSSAVALAPIFSGEFDIAGRRVGVIFSGGNVNTPDCGFFHQGVETKEAPAARASRPTAVRDKTRPRVLVTDVLDAAALRELQEAAEVDVRPDPPLDEFVRLISSYDALVVGPQQHVDSQVIDYGYKLRAIACATAQPDNIEAAAARDLGVEVIYVPGGNAVAIAEHTLARLLMLDNQFANGSLAGKTLGLVGYGRVAKQVTKRAEAFEMTVLANQPRLTPELAGSAGIESTDLLDLLGRADYVSLHVPFSPETQALLGAAELAQMKRGAFLVNTGHTDLVDEEALLEALQSGHLGGAAVSALPVLITKAPAYALSLRAHPRTIVAPHVSAIIEQQRPALDAAMVTQLLQVLHSSGAGDALSLELVPVANVTPHEAVDEKRVQRLVQRLQEEGRLVNPPVTTFWNGRYVILDGATRYAAFRQMGYRDIIVQVVPPHQPGLELHTWYHAISHEERPVAELLAELEQIEGVRLLPLAEKELRTALADSETLCYFLDRHGRAVLVQDTGIRERLDVMNELVTTYGRWGSVERTMLTDVPRLLAQFPQMQAVAVFPQFVPDEVFDAASNGRFLPAGLTRFLIPARILRLNADLERLKKVEPLAQKRAWFAQFLADKLTRSRLRYYQEPVILLDE